MVFDITDLDKVTVVQVLYDHSVSQNMGLMHQVALAAKGRLYEAITPEEINPYIETWLKGRRHDYVIDYHKGRPIKFNVEIKKGRWLAHSQAYDKRSGRFRFLEALLSVFDLKEILIQKKGYSRDMDFDNVGTNTYDRVTYYKGLLQKTEAISMPFGTRFKFLDGITHESKYIEDLHI